MFNWKNRKLLPVLIVLAAVIILIVMTALKAKPQKNKPLEYVPLVKTIALKEEEVVFTIEGTGTVTPTQEISLLSQVSGEIISLSENMKRGGRFSKGETLIKVNPIDYQLQVEAAQAEVARNLVDFQLKKEEMLIANEEWKSYNGSSSPKQASPLVLKKPQLDLAKANLQAAQARLKIAQLNLERTHIKAPFNGSVKLKNVSVGQYISLGTNLATLFNSDLAQITISLNNEELQWFNLEAPHKSKAIISAQLAGKLTEWNGWLDRFSAELNASNRMVDAIIRVNQNEQKTPLLSGLFVNVSLTANKTLSAFKAPLTAVRNYNEIWVVNDGKLDIRMVEILRRDDSNAYFKGGVTNGDALIISDLSYVSQGMKVKLEGVSNE
jgi:RND family efflux transporter MFP subunit